LIFYYRDAGFSDPALGYHMYVVSGILFQVFLKVAEEAGVDEVDKQTDGKWINLW
jgi:hypothetical protein